MLIGGTEWGLGSIKATSGVNDWVKGTLKYVLVGDWVRCGQGSGQV